MFMGSTLLNASHNTKTAKVTRTLIEDNVFSVGLGAVLIFNTFEAERVNLVEKAFLMGDDDSNF